MNNNCEQDQKITIRISILSELENDSLRIETENDSENKILPGVKSDKEIIKYFLKKLGFGDWKRNVGLFLLILLFLNIIANLMFKSKTLSLIIYIILLISMIILNIPLKKVTKKIDVIDLYNKLKPEQIEFLGNEMINDRLRQSIKDTDNKSIEYSFLILGSVLSILGLFSHFFSALDLHELVYMFLINIPLFFLSVSLLNNSSNKLIFKELLEHISTLKHIKE